MGECRMGGYVDNVEKDLKEGDVSEPSCVT